MKKTEKAYTLLNRVEHAIRNGLKHKSIPSLLKDTEGMSPLDLVIVRPKENITLRITSTRRDLFISYKEQLWEYAIVFNKLSLQEVRFDRGVSSGGTIRTFSREDIPKVVEEETDEIVNICLQKLKEMQMTLANKLALAY